MSPCYLARIRALIRSGLQGRRRKYWPGHGGSRIPKMRRFGTLAAAPIEGGTDACPPPYSVPYVVAPFPDAIQRVPSVADTFYGTAVLKYSTDSQKTKRKWGIGRIELPTSSTLRKNHTTRPNSRLFLLILGNHCIIYIRSTSSAAPKPQPKPKP
jgi:hypothetical protein